MSKKLEGKIALVTGGSRGIGAAIAKALARRGASVVFSTRRTLALLPPWSKQLNSLAERLSRSRQTLPVWKQSEVRFEKAVATFGRLDVLVNSAGTAIPKPFEETTLEEMDRVIDINLRGVLAPPRRR